MTARGEVVELTGVMQVTTKSLSTVPNAFNVLASFGVPSARFDDIGRVLELSTSAPDLLGVSLAEALRQGGNLVSELASSRTGMSEGFDVRTRPVADGRIMARAQRLAPGSDAGFAVVLFLPSQPAEVNDQAPKLGLSMRETEVARLIARGLSTKQIAAQLDISLHTARRHTERIFAKLGVQSRAQVVLLLAGSVPQGG